MRWTIALLASISLLPMPGLALSNIAVDDLAHHPIALDFHSGGQLDLRIRSGEIRIVGSDEDKIVVRAEGKQGSDSTDISARFEGSDHFGKLYVHGGPSNEVTITVQVPRNSDLSVRIMAGDVEVKDITGNKDVKLGAGDLTVDVGNAADYSHVEVSVTTGSIEASPFGESRGGLFRSFEKFGKGKYKLEAHVGAGDLTLK
jgi:DUF4097 and DUF4098 domain-containing protein YvlB